MLQPDGPVVRAAGSEPRARGASHWTSGARGFAWIVLAGTLSLLLALGTRELQARRAQAAERERAADAAARDRRDREDQIRVWSVALDADPGSALALSQLSGLYVQKARETGDELYYSKAEQMARRSLALRTQRNARTYVVLASTLLAQHRFREARAAAAAALALEPEVAQYRALLAEIDMELGDYAGAAAGFAGVARYRSHLSIGPRLARWAEVGGRASDARGILTELVAQAELRRDLPREQLAWFHFRLGDHYRRHGSPRRARRWLARALEINPGDYRAHKAMAELELARGKTRPALAHARAAVAASRTPETQLTLASALHESGDTAAARAVETEVAAAVGNDGGTFERAWHAYRLERGLAPTDLARLLEREVAERRDVAGYDLLAWAYYKSNRISEARAAIVPALRTGTSDATVWYHAGVIFGAAGDSARARALFRKAVTLNPAFEPAASGGLAAR